MVKTQNYLPKMGVDMCHYARLLQDGTEGTEYEKPKALPGAVDVAFTSGSQTGTYYADNGPYASAAQLGEMSAQLQSADLPPTVRAEWYGYDYKDGMLRGGQIRPVDMALMYRVLKANGAYRYVTLYKCKPGAPDDKASTQTNSITFQDGTVTMAVTMRVSDGRWFAMLDDDDPGLPEGITPKEIEQGWFTKVDWEPEEDAAE